MLNTLVTAQNNLTREVTNLKSMINNIVFMSKAAETLNKLLSLAVDTINDLTDRNIDFDTSEAYINLLKLIEKLFAIAPEKTEQITALAKRELKKYSDIASKEYILDNCYEQYKKSRHNQVNASNSLNNCNTFYLSSHNSVHNNNHKSFSF